MASIHNFLKRKEIVTTDVAIWMGTFRDRYKIEIGEFKETMRNLAVIIGAFAAGSLVLLASPVPQKQILTVIGIILLLCATILCNFLLFFRHLKVFSGIRYDRKKYHHPMIDVLKRFNTAHSSEEQKEAVQAHTQYEQYMSENDLSKVSNYGAQEFESPKGFVWVLFLFTTGLILIATGLLIPYLTIFSAKYFSFIYVPLAIENLRIYVKIY